MSNRSGGKPQKSRRGTGGVGQNNPGKTVPEVRPTRKAGLDLREEHTSSRVRHRRAGDDRASAKEFRYCKESVDCNRRTHYHSSKPKSGFSRRNGERNAKDDEERKKRYYRCELPLEHCSNGDNHYHIHNSSVFFSVAPRDSGDKVSLVDRTKCCNEEKYAPAPPVGGEGKKKTEGVAQATPSVSATSASAEEVVQGHQESEGESDSPGEDGHPDKEDHGSNESAGNPVHHQEDGPAPAETADADEKKHDVARELEPPPDPSQEEGFMETEECDIYHVGPGHEDDFYTKIRGLILSLICSSRRKAIQGDQVISTPIYTDQYVLFPQTLNIEVATGPQTQQVSETFARLYTHVRRGRIYPRLVRYIEHHRRVAKTNITDANGFPKRVLEQLVKQIASEDLPHFQENYDALTLTNTVCYFAARQFYLKLLSNSSLPQGDKLVALDFRNGAPPSDTQKCESPIEYKRPRVGILVPLSIISLSGVYMAVNSLIPRRASSDSHNWQGQLVAKSLIAHTGRSLAQLSVTRG